LVVKKCNPIRCWSSVGRIGAGEQQLSLAPKCIHPGVIAHEFMRAIGFWHMHQRPDRDKYIRINMGNVHQKQVRSFQRRHEYAVKGNNYKWDFKSIMLYGSQAFAKDTSRNVSSLWTIVRGKNQYIPYNAAVRGSLSKLDVSAINKLYNCCKDGFYCSKK